MFLKFPKNFLWGAATSAYQVEGSNVNDWSEWEKRTILKRLKKAKKKKWPDYILRQYPTPFDKENYISGRIIDHYHLFKEDFNIAKMLNQNVHRFSIEWSRVEPEEGKFNQEALEHYKEVASFLKKQGIEPFVTLWHFTIPIWLEKKGGLGLERSVDYFLRYVEKVVHTLKDDVKFWITINEPIIYSVNSYFVGSWPPEKRNILLWIKLLKNLLKMHCKSFDVIKRIQPDSQVGIAKNVIYFSIYKNSYINRIIKRLADHYWNFTFLDRMGDRQDFIGLNYYFTKTLDLFFRDKSKMILSDLDWKIYPKGIYNVLIDLKRYKKPIYITENGVADVRDKLRIKFIKDHLRWVWQAIHDGVDVRGYFYWSLLDNLEWDKGFWPRFGLVGIDYKTLKREIRASALEYAKICKDNGFNV